MLLKRLVLRFLLRGQPAEPAPIVHRGERELTSGPDLGAPAGRGDGEIPEGDDDDEEERDDA